jgi:hypothetical protein
MPRAIIFMSLVDTLLVVSDVFALTVQAPQFVRAINPIVRLLPDFTTTCCVVIVQTLLSQVEYVELLEFVEGQL